MAEIGGLRISSFAENIPESRHGLSPLAAFTFCVRRRSNMHQMFAAKLIGCVAILTAGMSADGNDKPADGRFDIGGPSIRLACKGTGGPAVVIEAGMGTAPVEDPGWQAFMHDIRTCLWEEAEDIAARVLSLRLVGALPYPRQTDTQ
jgi:hypothetical protein